MLSPMFSGQAYKKECKQKLCVPQAFQDVFLKCGGLALDLESGSLKTVGCGIPVFAFCWLESTVPGRQITTTSDHKSSESSRYFMLANWMANTLWLGMVPYKDFWILYKGNRKLRSCWRWIKFRLIPMWFLEDMVICVSHLWCLKSTHLLQCDIYIKPEGVELQDAVKFTFGRPWQGRMKGLSGLKYSKYFSLQWQRKW